ncbi:unnamed protein product [Clonostachys solani]|uniref:Uncharacterized protein n=1 Tax=Clonostachys solani TaxID=160281 RepID=A0A9N9W8K4_9HYPO|nr:unnamed protein product [Clonostachys solani]
MNAANDIHILVVDRMPVEVLLVKVEDYSNVAEYLVHCFVLDIGLALGSDKLPRKIALVKAVLGVVDRSVVAFFRIFILAFAVEGRFLLGWYSCGGPQSRRSSNNLDLLARFSRGQALAGGAQGLGEPENGWSHPLCLSRRHVVAARRAQFDGELGP